MNQLFVSLIILLVPGIVATLILDATMQHKKWDNFSFSVYVVIFGFFSYFVLFIVEQLLSLSSHTAYQFKVFDFLSNLESTKLERAIYWEIGLACFIAIILSLLASYAITHKWLTHFANKYDISDKYGDESLFYYYLSTGNRKAIKWLSVRDLVRNKLYTGALATYSEQDGVQELLLANVDVYPAEGDSYHLDNIYICGKIGDFSIEPLTVKIKGENNE